MKCPNVKHLDWIALENKIGYTEAYREYIKNNEEIPNPDSYTNTIAGKEIGGKLLQLLNSNQFHQMYHISFFSGDWDNIYNGIKEKLTEEHLDAVKDIIDNNIIRSYNDLIDYLINTQTYNDEIENTNIDNYANPNKNRILRVKAPNLLNGDEEASYSDLEIEDINNTNNKELRIISSNNDNQNVYAKIINDYLAKDYDSVLIPITSITDNGLIFNKFSKIDTPIFRDTNNIDYYKFSNHSSNTLKQATILGTKEYSRQMSEWNKVHGTYYTNYKNSESKYQELVKDYPYTKVARPFGIGDDKYKIYVNQPNEERIINGTKGISYPNNDRMISYNEWFNQLDEDSKLSEMALREQGETSLKMATIPNVPIKSINSSIIKGITVEEENHYINILYNNLIQIQDYIKSRKLKDIPKDFIKSNIIRGLVDNNETSYRNKVISEEQYNTNKRIIDIYNRDDIFYNKIKEYSKAHGITFMEDYITYDKNGVMNKQWEDSYALKLNLQDTFSYKIKSFINNIKKGSTFDKGIFNKLTNRLYFDRNTSSISGFAETLDSSIELPEILNRMNGAITKKDMLDRVLYMAETLNDSAYYEIFQALSNDEELANLWFSEFDRQQLAEVSNNVNTYGKRLSISTDINNSYTLKHKALANDWVSTIEEKMVNKEYDSKWIATMKGLMDEYTANISKFTQTSYIPNTDAIDTLSKIFNHIGIPINSFMINHFINTNNTKIRIKKLANIKNEDIPKLSLNQDIKMMADRLTNFIMSNNDGVLTFDFSEYNNLLIFTDEFKDYFKNTASSSYSNVEGENVNSWDYHNFISRLINILHDDKSATTYLQNMSKVDNMQYSNLLWILVNYDTDANGKKIFKSINKEGIDKLKVYNLGGIKNTTTNEGQTYSQLSAEDYDYITMVNYMSTVDTSDSGLFTFPIPSDRPSNRLMSMDKIRITDAQYLELKSNREAFKSHPIFNRFRNIVNQEIVMAKEAFNKLYDYNDGVLTVKDGVLNKTIKPIQFYHFQEFDDNDIPILIDSKGNPTGNVFKFDTLAFEGASLDNIISLDTLFANKFQLDEETFNNIDNYILKYIVSNINRHVKYYSPIVAKITKDSVTASVKLNHVNKNAFIAEFSLNTFLYNTEMRNFILGSHKMYKSSKEYVDTTKRATQAMVTNKSYMADENETFNAVNIKDVIIKSAMFHQIVNNYAIYKGIKLSPDRLHILSIDRNTEDKDFRRKFIDKYKLSLDEVELFDLSQAYYNLDTANAQSYITMDEYVKRIKKLGIYEDYKETLDRLTSGAFLTSTDMDKISSSVKLINSLKNFYYTYEYNEGLGINVPVQVKNSEFPLMPSVIKGTQLETLNAFMIKNNIQQINLESAVKIGNSALLTLHDADGNLRTDLTNEMFTSSAQSYSYRDLRYTQDVTEHIMDEENKLGIQIIKKVLDDILLDNKYSIGTGKQLITAFFEQYTALIYKDYQDVANDMQLKDDNTVDIKDMCDRLVDSFINSGMSGSMIDGVRFNSETGKANIPLYYSGIVDKISSVISSFFNNGIINTKFPGVHSTQLSNLFMDKKGGTTAIELAQSRNDMTGIDWSKDITSRNEFQGTYKLKSRIIKDNNGIETIEAEVLLGRWDKRFINIDGRPMSIDSIPAELKKMIGFRIPTEGKNSTIVFKVVGFLPEQSATNIVLPDEFVNQTGSDFDVDSVYTMLYNFKIFNGKFKKIESSTDIDVLYKRYIIKNLNKILKEGNNETSEISKYFNDNKDLLDRYNAKRKDRLEVLKEIGYNKAQIREQLEEMFTTEWEEYFLNSDIDLKNLASSNNLMSREEYGNISLSDMNSRQANQNKLLDIMISILSDKSHYADNMNPQGFPDISSSKKLVEDNVKQDRVNVNEALGQTILRTRVMEGRALKGISVNRDGFLSIAQFTKMQVGRPFIDTSNMNKETHNEIKYEADRLARTLSVKYDIFDSKGERVYNRSKLEARFGDKISFDKNGLEFTITNDYIGRSPNDYYNVDGKLVSQYSAQTTANILDNVKDPLPKNINKFTFTLYKTIIDLGNNYDYATAFITQPIIEDIIRANNRNESVLSLTPDRFFLNGIRNNLLLKIFEKDYVDPKTKKYSTKHPDGTPLSSEERRLHKMLWESIFVSVEGEILRKNVPSLHIKSNDKKAIYSHLGVELDSNNNSFIPIYSTRELLDIANEGSNGSPSSNYYREQLYIINKFEELNKVAKTIDVGATTFNTDKRQAKYESIVTLNKNISNLESNTGTTLIIGEDRAVNKIFNSNTVLESSYPALWSYKKYGHDVAYNVLSTILFKGDFIANITDRILNNMDKTRHTDTLIRKVRNYTLAYLYKDLPFMRMSNAEKSRIIGTDAKLVDLDITDNNNLDKFQELTLLNKIQLYKKYYRDEIASYNGTHLMNNIKIKSKVSTRNNYDTIQFINKKEMTNYMISSFSNMWSGNNMFARSIARDMIKYTFMTTGLTAGSGITSIIPSYIIYNEDNGTFLHNDGIGLSTYLYNKESEISSQLLDGTEKEFDLSDNFIRGNADDNNVVRYAYNRYREEEMVDVLDDDGVPITRTTIDESYPKWIPNEKGTIWIGSAQIEKLRKEGYFNPDNSIINDRYIKLHNKVDIPTITLNGAKIREIESGVTTAIETLWKTSKYKVGDYILIKEEDSNKSIKIQVKDVHNTTGEKLFKILNRYETIKNTDYNKGDYKNSNLYSREDIIELKKNQVSSNTALEILLTNRGYGNRKFGLESYKLDLITKGFDGSDYVQMLRVEKVKSKYSSSRQIQDFTLYTYTQDMNGNREYYPVNRTLPFEFTNDSVVEEYGNTANTEDNRQNVIDKMGSLAPIIIDGIDTSIVKYNRPMDKEMLPLDNVTGKKTTTIELCESGKRTATTRSKALGKVGDVITFNKRPTRYIITKVEPLTPENVANEEWIQEWSNKEQWTTEYFKKVLHGKTVHIGSVQTTFKRVEDFVQENKDNNIEEGTQLSLFQSTIGNINTIQDIEPTFNNPDNIWEYHLSNHNTNNKQSNSIDGVFHVGTEEEILNNDTVKIMIVNGSRYTERLKKGTDIDNYIAPIYRYDKDSKQWYKYNYSTFTWNITNTPLLTVRPLLSNSNDLSQYEIKAIKDVVARTSRNTLKQATIANVKTLNDSERVLATAKKYLYEAFIQHENALKLFKQDKTLKTIAQQFRDMIGTPSEQNPLSSIIQNKDELSVLEALNTELEYTTDFIEKMTIRLNTEFSINHDFATMIENDEDSAKFTAFMSNILQFIKTFDSATRMSSILEDSNNLTNNAIEINKVLNAIGELSNEVNKIKIAHDLLMDRYFEERVKQMTTNPNIINELRGVFDAQEDESFAQYALDAMDDTNNTFIANIIKFYKVRLYDKDKIVKEKHEEYRKKVEAYFGRKLEDLTAEDFDKFLETHNGIKTGRFTQRFDWDRFYDTKQKFMDSITAKPGSAAWSKAARKWYKGNEVNTMMKYYFDPNGKIIKEEHNLTEIEDVINEQKDNLNKQDFDRWLHNNIKTKGLANNPDIRLFSVKQIMNLIEKDNARFRISGKTFVEPDVKFETTAYTNLKNNKKDFEFFNYLKTTVQTLGDKAMTLNSTDFEYAPSALLDERDKTFMGMIKNQLTNKKDTHIVGIDNHRQFNIPFRMITLFDQKENYVLRPIDVGESPSVYEHNVVTEVNLRYNTTFTTLAEIRAAKNAINKENEQAHNKKVNLNLAQTIYSFIDNAYEYEFKKALESEMVEAAYKLESIPIKNINGVLERLPSAVRNRITGDKEQAEHVAGKATNTYKHFSKFMEMILYDEFEMEEGSLNKWGKIIQSITSAKAMWLNPMGALNNVVLGKINMAMETFAKYYWSEAELFAANKEYMSNASNLIANRGSENSTSIIDAIIKYFDIVEMQIEKGNNAPTEQDKKLHKWYMKTNGFYFMHKIGEHFMQNTALLAMIKSHHIYNGKIVSFVEYKMSKEGELLDAILTPKERTDLDAYMKDRYSNEQYTDAKLDYITDWLRMQPSNRLNEILSAKKKTEAEYKEEFDKLTTLQSGYELKDGKANYTGTLEKFEIEKFRNKVLKVNQKAHGIYTKIDAGVIQNQMLGRLAIQFKKWIRPGWNKRFGSKYHKSFWNEGRNEWDKGMYMSLQDFINTGAHERLRNMSEEDKNWHSVLTSYIKGYGDFVSNAKMYYDTLDDFEKANVKRASLEMLGLIMAVIAGYALTKLKGDDDDGVGEYLMDIAIYQTDRLYTDLYLYTPVGWINEGNKLMKNPMAAFGTMTDIGKLATNLFLYPIRVATGNDESNYYQSGVYKDDLKVKTNLFKITPILTKYQALERIDKSNTYYALFKPKL